MPQLTIGCTSSSTMTRDERQDGDVDDENAGGPRDSPTLQLCHERPYSFGEHDRDQHDQDDADDGGEERNQRDDAEHDERRAHERAHRHDVRALAARGLRWLSRDAVGSRPGSRLIRLRRRSLVWWSPDDASCQPGQPNSLRLLWRDILCVPCRRERSRDSSCRRGRSPGNGRRPRLQQLRAPRGRTGHGAHRARGARGGDHILRHG